MAELDANALLDFAGVLDDGREQRGGARVAVVARIDADGTAYVSLPGGVDETPLAGTGAALNVGDTVNVRIEGGKLRAVYNASDPAVGASYVAPIAGRARDAERSAASAESAAMEARKVAEAIDQHFFADGNGVHVTEAEGDATTEHNILINSLGILLRRAVNNLVSITQSAISFFDGQGNDASNIVAKFGADGAQIGMHDNHNLKLTSNSMGIYYGWDRLATFTSDANVTDVHFGGSDKAVGVKYSNAEVVDVRTFLQTCHVSDGKIYDGDDNLVPYTLSGSYGFYNVLDEDGDQFGSGMYSGIYYYEPSTSFNLSVNLYPEAEIPAVVNVDVSAFHAEVDEDAIAITDDEQNAVLTVRRNGIVDDANAVPGSVVPIGSVIDYAGSTVPSGYLECNGQAVSRTTYALLFAAIGTTWGAGDGSTTFNLPDFRGRVSIGAGTGTAGGATAHSMASYGGDERMPAHSHGNTIKATTPKFTHSITQPVFKLPNHKHTATVWQHNGTSGSGTHYGITWGDPNEYRGGGNNTTYISISNPTSLPNCTRSTDVDVGDHAATACTMSGSVSSEGSGTAGNMQPFATLRKIIRAV